MHTIIQRIDLEGDLKEQLKEAAAIIRRGGLVAFPTETVYGLGGDALNPNASAAIYAAKGRPSDNPLIVHIADEGALERIASEVPEKAYLLAERFWPGPLTILLHKSGLVPKETTGGLQTVGIRMPSHPIARALIEVSGTYIAAPSANRSGRPSTTSAQHVIEDLKGRVDMILDGGHVPLGLESTIIDLTAEVPLVLRPGYITLQELTETIGRVEYDRAVTLHRKDDTIVAKAPGMKYRHYAPQGNLVIYEGEANKVVRAINEQAERCVRAGEKVGILAADETADSYHYGAVRRIGSRAREEVIAAHLFDCLREFDDLGVTRIFSESFEDNSLGQAIMNRLLKAAGYQVVEIR